MGEVEAVLGLPLGEIVIREVHDVAAPSVGRLQRTSCTYAGTGAVRGEVLELTAGRYTDAAAARAQRERNAVARSLGAERPVGLGAARGIELTSDGGPELLLDYGPQVLELRLPPAGAARPAAADVLTDLALRALARLPGSGDPVPPRAPAPTAGRAPGADPADVGVIGARAHGSAG
ncbi:hypothetical protein I4I73_14030 [Pseudonocardia sp. KRD-184]|uniref:Uncharacterized protein n=1 Tax=Pseudonocardia oceani TaxID=2792013 RepID=A0ABS6UHC2_9PSEU|nr:hypothetical protein [Pseudonocardia oceani]MBW0091302.1 hypothetical protein [Pseudonocardia oceani]MBW0097108.1 hypothetical protein [Pseudonocardia oceani]MBW0110903.1 hypothetical protein [Pseudonocardia oceani]MBW0123939.1 hypothetical protein [Pseudonocardia oceani]MBW0131662.1 hypothetical protein [Pseudonocardia oceani]